MGGVIPEYVFYPCIDHVFNPLSAFIWANPKSVSPEYSVKDDSNKEELFDFIDAFAGATVPVRDGNMAMARVVRFRN